MSSTRWLLLVLLAALAAPSAELTATPAGAADCSQPSRVDPDARTLCTLADDQRKGVSAIDGGTGLVVVDVDADLDWASADRASMPWSTVVRIRTGSDGDSELAVFDRHHTSDFGTGAKDGVVTRWTVDGLRGVLFRAGGCGLLTCTYGRGGVAPLPDALDLVVNGRSHHLQGADGEFSLPQAFIDDVIAAGPAATLQLRLLRGSTSTRSVPIGKGTIAALQQLYARAVIRWPKPAITLMPQRVGSGPLSAEAIATASLPSVLMLRHQGSVGSGFVIGPNGLILTNRHVLSGGARRLKISAEGGLSSEGEVIYVDRQLDIALVRAEGLSRLRPLPLCHAGYPRPGAAVVALGSPLGLAGTVTQGIVSAVRHPRAELQAPGAGEATLIQTDASMSPGNSGGPLLNSSGEVVGVNTWMLRARDGGIQNLNFAISIVDVLRSLEVKGLAPVGAVNACGNPLAGR